MVWRSEVSELVRAAAGATETESDTAKTARKATRTFFFVDIRASLKLQIATVVPQKG
jgi:hypothetical protein